MGIKHEGRIGLNDFKTRQRLKGLPARLVERGERGRELPEVGREQRAGPGR